jgi:cysteine-rich repeat protein
MKIKGLSNLVAYVLLIVVVIILAILIYGWLRFFVEGENVAVCPEGTNTVIESYACTRGVDGNLTLRLKNRGLFNVDGFIVRVHNRSDADFGFYVLDETGKTLAPDEDYSVSYSFSGTGLSDVTFVDVQPFVNDGKKVLCQAYASQRVSCGVCGDGVVDAGEQCDDGNNINGDGCNAFCITELVWDGFSLGMNFYDYNQTHPMTMYLLNVSGDINPARIRCNLGGGNCYFVNHDSRMTFKTPPIYFAGVYNFTYQVRLTENNPPGDIQNHEDYSFSCGTGDYYEFLDGNHTGGDPTKGGDFNVSVLCNFGIGENEFTFASLPSSGPGESVHFFYFKIEGPIA